MYILGYDVGGTKISAVVGDILKESHKRFHTSMVTNGWRLEKKITMRTMKEYGKIGVTD